MEEAAVYTTGKEEKAKIIAVDFDGTLCENKWPEIGEPNMKLILYLREEKRKGSKLILWSCRTQEQLAEALEWCFWMQLEFDAVNQNLPEIIEMFGEDTRKIFADEYIDDRACTKFDLPVHMKKVKEK